MERGGFTDGLDPRTQHRHDFPFRGVRSPNPFARSLKESGHGECRQKQTPHRPMLAAALVQASSAPSGSEGPFRLADQLAGEAQGQLCCCAPVTNGLAEPEGQRESWLNQKVTAVKH
eukprot:3475445-Rhodomonas_salina.1